MADLNVSPGELISFRPVLKFLAFFSTALDFFVSFFIKKKRKSPALNADESCEGFKTTARSGVTLNASKNLVSD